MLMVMSNMMNKKKGAKTKRHAGTSLKPIEGYSSMNQTNYPKFMGGKNYHQNDFYF